MYLIRIVLFKICLVFMGLFSCQTLWCWRALPMLEDRIVFRVHEEHSAFIPSAIVYFHFCEEIKLASCINANMDDEMTIAEVISL